MKDELKQISDNLKHDVINEKVAKEQLFILFGFVSPLCKCNYDGLAAKIKPFTPIINK